jgi:KUP system potassium uptake protein
VISLEGIWRVTLRFGFIEIPDLCEALRSLEGLDPSIDLDNAVYFGTRDLIVRKPGSSLFTHWRLPLFSFLYRNAVKMVDRFNLPPQNVVEIARQIEI